MFTVRFWALSSSVMTLNAAVDVAKSFCIGDHFAEIYKGGKFFAVAQRSADKDFLDVLFADGTEKRFDWRDTVISIR